MGTPSHREALASADTHVSEEACLFWTSATSALQSAARECPACFSAVAERSKIQVKADMLVTRFVNAGQLADMVVTAARLHETAHPLHPAGEADTASRLLARAADAAETAARYRSYALVTEPSEAFKATVIFSAHLRVSSDPSGCAAALEETDWRFLGVDIPSIARHDPLLVSNLASTSGISEALLLNLHHVKPSEALLVAAQIAAPAV